MPSTTPSESPSANDILDERSANMLRWRSRRGMVENDLFIERFFARYVKNLTVRQGAALSVLMDLSDNDLLDLHLGRKTPAEVNPELDRDDVHEVLTMLRENR